MITFFRPLGYFFLLTFLLIQTAVGQTKRPNIVYIMTDSHRGDALGINGGHFVKTPHLDEMARNGMRFTNTYVTSAICVVSRASILSGQHVARHGVNDFGAEFSNESFAQTYPMLLKKEGYSIAQIGFLGVGKGAHADKFDHWDVKIPWMSKEGVHQTDHITEKAEQYLEKQDGKQPFYLSISYEAAHEIDGRDGNPATYLIQDRFKNLYADIPMPVPSTYSAAHWEKFPDFFRSDDNIARARLYGFLSTPALQQENSRNYYRLLTGLDEAVGKIIKKLKSLGLDENTIVVYTSDHGFSLGEHGLMGKWYGFEKSVHVPLIIQDLRRNSSLKKGVSDQLVLNIDIAPTLLEMAGITPPATMQGKNVFTIAAQKKPVRRHYFYEHTILRTPLLPKVEGVIGPDYKYFVYTEHNYEVLYDTRKDPEEQNDVARDPKYKKLLQLARATYQDEKRNAK